MDRKRTMRSKKASATISTLYIRGERSVKLNRTSTGSMLTFEKALERLARGKVQ